jgi:hypothetical protein
LLKSIGDQDCYLFAFQIFISHFVIPFLQK